MADPNNPKSDMQLLEKKASFIQHSLPGLPAGVYEVTVKQEFADSEGKALPKQQPPTLTRTFGVQGPKYSLPAGTVNMRYPPPDSAGGYSNSLAHTVLTAEKLPWIRSPYLPTMAPPSKENHYEVTYDGESHRVTYDDDVATWMAVLTLSPSDIDGADPTSLIKKGKAIDVIPNAWKAQGPNGTTPQGTLPAYAYSIFSYTLEDSSLQPAKGIVDPGVGHSSDEACTYINIPAKLFAKIAPSIDDLKMMAHVRSVKMDAKPIQDGDSTNVTQTFSLVVGNRLPETLPEAGAGSDPKTPAIGANVAVLVSLEHLQYALRGYPADSYFATKVLGDLNGFVRLPVFAQWRFTSWHDTSYDFEKILKSVNTDNGFTPGTTEDDAEKITVPNPRFRNPNIPSYPSPTPEQTSVVEMMELGYTPMNHLTRVPDVSGAEPEPIQTVSWYRGPLSPFDVEDELKFLSGDSTNPADQSPLVYSADKLLRFDPNLGIYDTSYAAAWQIGQLIALQDKSFSTALYRWKKSTDQKYRMMLENAVLQDSFSDVVESFAASETATMGAGDKVVYRSALNFLATPSKP